MGEDGSNRSKKKNKSSRHSQSSKNRKNNSQPKLLHSVSANYSGNSRKAQKMFYTRPNIMLVETTTTNKNIPKDVKPEIIKQQSNIDVPNDRATSQADFSDTTSIFSAFNQHQIQNFASSQGNVAHAEPQSSQPNLAANQNEKPAGNHISSAMKTINIGQAPSQHQNHVGNAPKKPEINSQPAQLPVQQNCQNLQIQPQTALNLPQNVANQANNVPVQQPTNLVYQAQNTQPVQTHQMAPVQQPMLQQQAQPVQTTQHQNLHSQPQAINYQHAQNSQNHANYQHVQNSQNHANYQHMQNSQNHANYQHAQLNQNHANRAAQMQVHLANQLHNYGQAQNVPNQLVSQHAQNLGVQNQALPNNQMQFMEFVNNPMMMQFMNYLSSQMQNNGTNSQQQQQPIGTGSCHSDPQNFEKLVENESKFDNSKADAKSAEIAQLPDLELNSKISASTSKSTSHKNQKLQKKSKNTKTNISIASESSNNTTVDVKTPKDKKSKTKPRKNAKKNYEKKRSSQRHSSNGNSDDDQSEILSKLDNFNNDSSFISNRSSRGSGNNGEHNRSDDRRNNRNYKQRQNSNSNYRRSNLFTVHEVDDSIQTIIRSNLASKNMGSNKFHTFNEINQVHSIVWLMYKSDLSFTQFGPSSVFDFVNCDDYKGISRVSCKDLIIFDEDENQMVDEKLALLSGPYYLNNQTQVEDASSFCTSQIHELEMMEFEEFEPDHQSTILFWKFVDLFINSGDRKVKNSDIAKIFTDYFLNFHGENQAIIAIQEICPQEIDIQALELLLSAKYKQSLRQFSEISDFIHMFCLSGCMDIREKCLKNPQQVSEHSHFLETLKLYATNLSNQGKYILPMVFSFISGTVLSDLGLKRAEIVLQYWPLIISLMLLFSEVYSAPQITNCLNQMINSLSHCNMPITAQLCVLIMNTCFKSEYERNFEKLVQQMLVFRFDVNLGSKVSNYPISFQYSDMLAKVMKKHWNSENENLNSSKITLKALSVARMALAVKLHKHGRISKAFQYVKAIVDSYDDPENQFAKDPNFARFLWSVIDIGLMLVSMPENEIGVSEDKRNRFKEDLKRLSSLQNINSQSLPTLPKQEFIEKAIEENSVREMNEQLNTHTDFANQTNSPNLSRAQTIESPIQNFNDSPLQPKSPIKPSTMINPVSPVSPMDQQNQQNALDSFFNDIPAQSQFQLDSPGETQVGISSPPNFLQGSAMDEGENRNEQVQKFYESQKPFQSSQNNDNSKNPNGGGGLMGKMFGSIGRKLSASSIGNNMPAVQPTEKVDEKPVVDLTAPPPSMDLVNMGNVQNLDVNKGQGNELTGAYVNIFNI